jgi:hypothetical protein
MEAQNQAQPKRKFVMTPERKAKLMANLEKARLAPKEKVYRKTPKRYAANIGNLAKANAKLREKSESLRPKLEELFPAPEVPPPPVVPLAAANLQPDCVPPSDCPAGATELDQAAALIARRLRKVQAASRREGRRIMRVLTAAISRSQPLGANEAFNLALRLLQCLEGSRVTREARRLNDEIADLLLQMIATRYGTEVEVDGVPLATLVELIEEKRRQRAAAREARDARQAQAAQDRRAAASEGTAPAPAEGEPAADGAADGRQNHFKASGGQSEEPSQVTVLALPKTVEEFQGLLARALDLEGEDAAAVVAKLAQAIWIRLQWWKLREHTETQQLERLFQETAATPPGSMDDFLKRTFDINFVLKLNDAFLHRMDGATEIVAEALRWWLNQRPVIASRRRKAGRPPSKPPVNATSGGPTSGSVDPSDVA